ncbi:YSIRK-type signal peptide-containing protein [Enterococcus faecium]|nr:YSIRK-type signal peptide-containing protein [Enterococcus faecium]
MVSKNNKRVFLEKTKKRVLKYSIKKLSVGVASVLIGVGLVLGTTELVKAQDEISPSSPLETAISSVQVGDKVASGNTFQENPGYTKNYNFSDLQFSPQELTGDTLKGNTIGFEVYGKHNIAASTKNWEIRLQLDERLAKYVEKIQVDPKKGIGSSRRTFVRINDSLGRPTNIWKVNYIRASDGLFAGAETTDTQTAPNGVITFEKSLDEIFKEIGIDNLKTDRLMYRIYLVSHQDDDKIVPGIDSTGYFLTDSDDFYNSLDVSENNPDQFKHGSVSAKYEKPNTQTKDGSGSTGANGAIILDHKLTKNYNFSYSSSAKGTPWYANYKIDERLVPYVAGIQMHMVQADKVTYDVSFESGTKVADLAIERREGHEIKIVYQDGSVGTTDLAVTVSKDIYENPGENIPAGYHKVTFTAGEGTSIESGTTVFAVKDGVSLPEDKLPVLKAKDGYTDAKWPEEATQPITADDTEFVSSATKLDDIIENPGDNIPAGYHKVTFTAGEGTSIESGTTVFAVKDGVSLPEDKLPVLKAKDGYTDAKWPEEATQPITADDTEFVSSATKLDDIIENPGDNIPAGYHKVTFTAGEGTSIESGTTVFAVKDGVSLPEDKLPVLKAKDGYTDAKWPEEATQPITADDTEFVSSATKLDDIIENPGENIPAGYHKVTFTAGEGTSIESGTTVFAVKDGVSLPEDKLPVLKAKDGYTDAKWPEEATQPITADDTEFVSSATKLDDKSDADKYNPEGQKVTTELNKEPDAFEGIKNKEDLPKDTKYTWKEKVDVSAAGNKKGTVVVTYPDGSSDEVEVDVTVTDNRSDADKYEPTVEGEKVEVGGTVDLTDNVTNLPTLPEGTTVTDVTPGGTIDTNTPGNYEGVIEVTYPDGTKDTVKVPVEVTDNRSDADKYEPTVEGEKVEVGGTVDLTDNVTNLPALPEGTTVTDVTPGGTIDTNTPGNYEGVIEVTYPDGTKDTVKVPVEVTDNRSDADKYEPTVEGEKVEIGGTVDLTDNVTNLPALPEGTTVTDVTPGGTIDTNTPGNYEGVIEVTYPDGTKDTVKVPVEVTDNRSNADKYNPEGQKVTTDLNKEPDASEGIKNKEDLPKGTTYAWKEKVDVSTAGNKKGTIVVTYPDGSSDEVEVDVTVTDTRSDADKYNPEGQKVTTDLNKEPDASEGIKNKEDLPKGTTYTWKEKVDVSTAGNKKGTVVVTYPDGSKEEVEVTISVVDKKAPNKPQVDPITEGDQIVTGKTEPNAEVTVTLPDGSQHHGTADKNGNFTVKVPKLEAGTKVIVTATDESGNTSEPTNVVVSSNKKDSGKNGSKGSKTDNQGSNSNQDKNRGKSQSSKVFPKTGESDSNIFTISGGLILLGTLGLLGYKNRKKENE